jgi:hypothetical protein
VGSTSILMAWALESTAWLYAPRGRVKPLPREDETSRAMQHLRKRSDLTAAPDEIMVDADAAKGRSHVAELASTTDLKTDPDADRRPHGDVIPLTAFPMLQGSTGPTVWNVTAVLAVLLTTAIGVFISLSWAHHGLSPALFGATEMWATAGSAVAASAVAVVAIGRRGTAARWAWWGVLTVAVGAVAWWVAASAGGISFWRGILVALIATGLLVYFHWFNYTLFRDASADRLKHPWTPAKEALALAFIGRRTLALTDAPS